MIPFFDLCNHVQSNKSTKVFKSEVVTVVQKGEINISLIKSFKSGQKYQYSYTSKAGNEKLLLYYGFILENNSFSNTVVKQQVFKPQMTREKLNLMKKLNVIENPYDLFFSTNQQSINLYQQINNNSINEDFLNQIRIYFSRNENWDENLIESRLQKEQWINYENEIISLSAYRSYIYNGNVKPAKLTLPDIIQSLEITQKWFNDQSSNTDQNLFVLYDLRKKIMDVLRESVSVQLSNIYMADEMIKNVVSDQVKKLKDFYLNENEYN